MKFSSTIGPLFMAFLMTIVIGCSGGQAESDEQPVETSPEPAGMTEDDCKSYEELADDWFDAGAVIDEELEEGPGYYEQELLQNELSRAVESTQAYCADKSNREPCATAAPMVEATREQPFDNDQMRRLWGISTVFQNLSDACYGE